jgi:hypothetical protein
VIIEAIVGGFTGAVRGLIDALPAVNPNHDMAGLGTMVATFRGGDTALHGVVGAMVGVISVALVYEAGSWLYHAANWVYRHIPMVGGG